VTVAPRVEDLLASIRKAIDNDLGGLAATAAGSFTSDNQQGTLMRGAIREMRVSYGSEPSNQPEADIEIAELRNRITKSRGANAFVTPKLQPTARAVERLTPAQKRGGITEILAKPIPQVAVEPAPVLRQSYAEEEHYEPPYVQDQSAEWEEPQIYAEPPAQGYYQPEQGYAPQQQQALVSPQAAYSAQASFQNLADTILARATSERSLEDMTRELLRGMLKTWLDDNLPTLVESLVREEIERVARRGR
jgi:uncharacterized protein